MTGREGAGVPLGGCAGTGRAYRPNGYSVKLRRLGGGACGTRSSRHRSYAVIASEAKQSIRPRKERIHRAAELMDQWIPGSCCARPGMTRERDSRLRAPSSLPATQSRTAHCIHCNEAAARMFRSVAIPALRCSTARWTGKRYRRNCSSNTPALTGWPPPSAARRPAGAKSRA